MAGWSTAMLVTVVSKAGVRLDRATVDLTQGGDRWALVADAVQLEVRAVDSTFVLLCSTSVSIRTAPPRPHP